MDEEEFSIPIALGPAGALIPPSKAEKGIVYRCPGCVKEIIFRKGKILQPHFAHRGDSNCNPESILHQAGKRCISNVIEGWKTGTFQKPLVIKKHEICGRETSYDLPDTIVRTLLEHRIESGRILDVALMDFSGVVLGVEIYVTHRVDAAKKSAIPFPWIELDAGVLLENQSKWFCRQDAGCFEECSACKAMIQSREEELDAIIEREKARLAAIGNQNAYQRLHSHPFPRHSFTNAPITPTLPLSAFHPTTFMSLEKVEMTLERVSTILDLFEKIEGPLDLPSGGIIEDPVEFVDTIRRELGDTNRMEEYRKKMVLWKLSEFLVPAVKHVKGSTPEEKAKNKSLVEQAMTWVGAYKTL